MERKRGKGTRVGEALMQYRAEPPAADERGLTRLSSKNQITLPVAMVRALGWKPGDEIDLHVWDGAIHLRKQLGDHELLDWLQGSMAHVPEWSTKEAIDEYIRNERDSWNREWDQD
jgi:AbrB family looped-hinge helix DNA binding protein